MHHSLTSSSPLPSISTPGPVLFFLPLRIPSPLAMDNPLSLGLLDQGGDEFRVSPRFINKGISSPCSYFAVNNTTMALQSLLSRHRLLATSPSSAVPPSTSTPPTVVAAPLPNIQLKHCVHLILICFLPIITGQLTSETSRESIFYRNPSTDMLLKESELKIDLIKSDLVRSGEEFSATTGIS